MERPYHITKITNKANSTRGFLQRNLRQCSTNVKSLAYIAYVRPIVEYASVVWSPHTQSQKNLLEMVQHKATRFVFNSYTRNTSVTALFNKSDWLTLEDRRNYAKVIMFYKMLHNAVSIDFLPYLHPSSTITRDHIQRFIPISTRVNCYHSFLPQPSESGTPSLSKLLLLKMLMTFRLITHMHIYTLMIEFFVH